jgi:uncharacterized protein (DUF433 family)
MFEVIHMVEAAIQYVFQTAEGAWRIADSRVSLDSVVHAYLEGQSPEAIALDFPALSLEQIHGSLAFYLRHRTEIHQYLMNQDARWERLRQESEAAHGPLLNRIRALRGKISNSEGSA